MPKNTTEYNLSLQQRMENLRKAISQRIKAHLNEIPVTEEEAIPEPIEEIPIEEDSTRVSGLNKPRVRTHGGPTNLNTKAHVEVRDNGGEIN